MENGPGLQRWVSNPQDPQPLTCNGCRAAASCSHGGELCRESVALHAPWAHQSKPPERCEPYHVVSQVMGKMTGQQRGGWHTHREAAADSSSTWLNLPVLLAKA